MPLARLAQGTRGYDLLRAVLGKDPITGEPVPQTADNLIGGFMKLIGQEEVWTNLKRANAVARAFAWFKGTLAGVLAFVRQIPTVFIAALRSLELMDIVVLPRAFGKLVGTFAAFVGSFISWAGGQVLSLLQIIFEVLAPAVMPYIRKAMGAFREIIRNPVGFIRNLVRAGIQGFRQFAGNFLGHLKRSIIDWLTGSMQGANLYYPKAFELREILKFVLSVLGLTWDNIRSKLVRAVGEPVVATLEKTFDIVVTFVREGPAAAWQQIRDAIGNLRDMVMDQVMAFVRERIVTVAIQTLVTSLNPAGAFIQAVLAIYNTIMFLVERLRTIGQVLASFIDSISAIAAGAIGSAANRVETTMAGLLTLVISFLARLIRPRQRQRRGEEGHRPDPPTHRQGARQGRRVDRGHGEAARQVRRGRGCGSADSCRGRGGGRGHGSGRCPGTGQGCPRASVCVGQAPDRGRADRYPDRG